MSEAEERFPPGTVAFLRVVVTGHDPAHFAPVSVETVGANGRPDDRSLVHWVRPEHLVTLAEAKRIIRGGR